MEEDANASGHAPANHAVIHSAPKPVDPTATHATKRLVGEVIERMRTKLTPSSHHAKP